MHLERAVAELGAAVEVEVRQGCVRLGDSCLCAGFRKVDIRLPRRGNLKGDSRRGAAETPLIAITGKVIGRLIYDFLEEGIQTPMVRGGSTKSPRW